MRTLKACSLKRRIGRTGGSRLDLAAFGDVLPEQWRSGSYDCGSNAAGTSAPPRIIAIDRPGCGGTDPPPAGQDPVQAVTADVEAVLGHLGISSVSNAGASVGGLYALLCAEQLLLSRRTSVNSIVCLGSVVPDNNAVQSSFLRWMLGSTPGNYIAETGLRLFRLAAWNTSTEAWSKLRLALSPAVRARNTQRSALDDALESRLDQDLIIHNTRESLRRGVSGLLTDIQISWGFQPVPNTAWGRNMQQAAAAAAAAAAPQSTDLACVGVWEVNGVLVRDLRSRATCPVQATPSQGAQVTSCRPAVHFWHGTDDPVVPIAHIRRMACSLHNATLHEVRDRGHLSSIVTAVWADGMRGGEGGACGKDGQQRE